MSIENIKDARRKIATLLKIYRQLDRGATIPLRVALKILRSTGIW
jgi:hypothetical protein